MRYAVKEYACTAIDVIARRLRLAFLNVQAAQEALPTIIDIMGEELNWNSAEKKVTSAAVDIDFYGWLSFRMFSAAVIITLPVY